MNTANRTWKGYQFLARIVCTLSHCCQIGLNEKVVLDILINKTRFSIIKFPNIVFYFAGVIPKF